MAKGVGLDAGEFEIKVVELDGSFRKPRLTKVSVDRVSQPDSHLGDAAHAEREAEAALGALKDAKVSRENVVLGFPCRETVLRQIEVPFRGAEQIRKVIKFEVEDSIHSHNVDDMIVDFHELEVLEGGTRVLVAAAPKAPLQTTLDALNSFGVDPEFVDLDAMALFRVAQWAGCLDAPIDDVEETSGVEDTALLPVANVAGVSKRARVIIDIGGRSTRIVATVDGDLLDIRALRVGVDAIADDLAAAKGIDVPTAREAMFSVLQDGESYECVPAAADDADDGLDGEGEGAQVTAVANAMVSHSEVVTASSELLRRMHRELVRFVASLKGVDGVEVAYVTGGGSFLPGLDEVLRDVFGCPTRQLPVLANLNHNLDEEEALWIEPRIAVAVGLALGTMGGAPMMQFRQEDLAFQRSFDRIKFPLAIACMLAIFLLVMFGWRNYKLVEQLGQDYGAIYQIEEKGGRGQTRQVARFWGFVNNLMHDSSPYAVSKLMDSKSYQKLMDQVIAADTFDRLPVIQRFLKKHLSDQQQATGIYEDLQLRSGYFVLAEFCEILERVEEELGSFVIRRLQVNVGARGKSDDFIEFDIALRGDGFRSRIARLKSAFEPTFSDPASPFASFNEGKRRAEDPYIGQPGAIYQLRIDLKEGDS